MASETVNIITSSASRNSGVKRNENMNSAATRMMGMQIHLFSPSR